MRDLKYLHLGCIAGLTDAACETIRNNKELEYLNLGDNDHFTDSGITNLKSLVELRVSPLESAETYR